MGKRLGMTMENTQAVQVQTTSQQPVHQPMMGHPGMGNPISMQAAYDADLTILPAERIAVDALVKAYRQFSSIAEHYKPYPAGLIREFVEGIHWAQLAVGTVRFYHALNQEYRLNLPSDNTENLRVKDAITTPERLAVLKAWSAQFNESLVFKQYPAGYTVILRNLLAAWEQMLALTEQFPDQHVYDDFKRGILRCESVLNRLHHGSVISN